MPEDSLSDLWDSIKGLAGKAEGGLENLWNHLKSGEAKAEKDALIPGPIQHVGRAIKELPERLTPEPTFKPGEERTASAALRNLIPQATGIALSAGPGAIGEGTVGLPARVGAKPTPEGGGGLPPPPERPALPGPQPTEPEGGMPRTWTAEPLEIERGPGKESAQTIQNRLAAMDLTQDKLAQLHGEASSDKLKFTEQYRDVLTELTPNEKLNLESHLEWQPGMRQPPTLTPRAERIMNEIVKPSEARAKADWKYLQENTDLDPELVANMEGESEGYLHRIRISPQRPTGGSPFDPFGGVRTLRQKAGSQFGRKFHVLQNAEGDRVFVNKPPQGDYGSKVRDTRGREWEIRRATRPEVEQNTDNRFLPDPVLATLHNEMQLRIARRNVEAMKGEIIPEMERQGLASSDPKTQRQLGFQPSLIPSLRGHFFEPRVAKAFDDFYRTPSVLNFGDKGGILGQFEALNRLAINAMFINPIGHMRNVLSDYMLARSGLWNTPGDGFAPHMRGAWSDVWNKTPLYHQVLRQSGSLMGADAANRVAFDALMNKVRKQMADDPMIDRIAKETGVWKTGKAWGEALYVQSQRAMWGFHDIMMMAQVRALMAQGRPLPQAVREAEKYIANYRVPASVGERGKLKVSPVIARQLSEIMQDRSLFVFGRYHYNKLAALGRVINEGVRSAARVGRGLTDQDKEQLARFAYMTLSAGVFSEAVNAALGYFTGNPEAKMSVPGAVGVPARLYQAAKGAATQNGEGWWNFVNALRTIITPMPAIDEFGNQFIWGKWDSDLPVAKQALERGTSLLGTGFAPYREVETMVTGRGIPALGISTPDPNLVARARRPPRPSQVRAQERRYERRVPFSGIFEGESPKPRPWPHESTIGP